MGHEPVAVGVIGCGNISDTYLKNCARSPHLRVLACADLDLQRARAKAEAYTVPRVYTPDEMLDDPEIELVINLTVPQAHAEVALATLSAGKSVYNEKPLAAERADGRRMLDLAAERGLRIGGAPDTFLGGGLQTCRALIDAGAIGRPVAASASFLSRGMEHWHPNPAFFFQPGGGPLFDMGPYYLTALISLLGPVRRLAGSAEKFHPERLVSSEPLRGTRIPVEVPTHVTAILQFAAGAVATLVASFDVGESYGSDLVIYGTEGALCLPDPNTFGGPVRLRRGNAWEEVPIDRANTESSRGIGPADMAAALRSGRPHRASGELAYHVLDIMHAIHESAAEGRHITPQSTCERPAPLPAGLPDLTVEEV
jgi:predicted dehydrogenase